MEKQNNDKLLEFINKNELWHENAELVKFNDNYDQKTFDEYIELLSGIDYRKIFPYKNRLKIDKMGCTDTEKFPVYILPSGKVGMLDYTDMERIYLQQNKSCILTHVSACEIVSGRYDFESYEFNDF